ncbi:MAG: hypothetical protein HY906_24385 [Deltaproteobacteria bacterium]|nr:hypothetical protein [Deltaproteobacteria bacterium]
MARVPAVRFVLALVGTCLLLGVSGCAKGAPMQQDASVPQQDAEAQGDGEAQADGPRDGPLQADGPKDGPLQQDGQTDTPLQQDAQHDVFVQSDAGECSNDVDCLPDAGVITDGGRYCYTATAKCYEPGVCHGDSECPTGQICKPLVQTCSCPSLGFTCRPHEICLYFPVWLGNFCAGE